MLNYKASVAGIPQVHHFGQEGLHNVLVIDLLGPNLEDLFDMCGRKFSIKTVCMAAKQMVMSFLHGSPCSAISLLLPRLRILRILPLVTAVYFLFFQVTRVQSVHDKSLIY